MKIKESLVRDFIFDVSVDYTIEKFGGLDALAEKQKQNPRFNIEATNFRLECQKKLTQKWLFVLEGELRAQRLELEGISREEQIRRTDAFLDKAYSLLDGLTLDEVLACSH
jgi:hypothetical protein